MTTPELHKLPYETNI